MSCRIRWTSVFCCVALSFFASSLIAADQSAVEGSDASDKGWITLSNDLSAFQQPGKKWKVVGNAALNLKNKKTLIAEPGKGAIINGEKVLESPDLITKQEWGDAEVTLEFMIPQGSNSGVKMEGLYEIQIVDTAHAKKLTSGDVCGGVYPRAELKPHYRYLDKGVIPRVNAAKPAGQWQTLDIVFRAPRFDTAGKKIENARFVRVTLNGQRIHENVELLTPTGWRWHEKERATGPLLLQGDHGQVIFRNVRIRPIETKTSKN